MQINQNYPNSLNNVLTTVYLNLNTSQVNNNARTFKKNQTENNMNSSLNKSSLYTYTNNNIMQDAQLVEKDRLLLRGKTEELHIIKKRIQIKPSINNESKHNSDGGIYEVFNNHSKINNQNVDFLSDNERVLILSSNTQKIDGKLNYNKENLYNCLGTNDSVGSLRHSRFIKPNSGKSHYSSGNINSNLELIKDHQYQKKDPKKSKKFYSEVINETDKSNLISQNASKISRQGLLNNSYGLLDDKNNYTNEEIIDNFPKKFSNLIECKEKINFNYNQDSFQESRQKDNNELVENINNSDRKSLKNISYIKYLKNEMENVPKVFRENSYKINDFKKQNYFSFENLTTRKEYLKHTQETNFQEVAFDLDRQYNLELPNSNAIPNTDNDQNSNFNHLEDNSYTNHEDNFIRFKRQALSSNRFRINEIGAYNDVSDNIIMSNSQNFNHDKIKDLLDPQTRQEKILKPRILFQNTNMNTIEDMNKINNREDYINRLEIFNKKNTNSINHLLENIFGSNDEQYKNNNFIVYNNENKIVNNQILEDSQTNIDDSYNSAVKNEKIETISKNIDNIDSEYANDLINLCSDLNLDNSISNKNILENLNKDSSQK